MNKNSIDFKNGSISTKFTSYPKFTFLEDCYLLPPEPHQGYSLPGRTSDGLLDCYIMDPASIFAARALNVQLNQKVLDMCAAPGGKTLIIAEALQGTGELIANELSSSRRERLQGVLRQYISPSQRENIWIKGKDGTKFGLLEPEKYDRILIDAPCSGERHLLQSPKDLKEWSVARGKNLAFRQYALLSSAWAALKKGGRLVYSTCSINPIENDEIINKLIKKKKQTVKILESEYSEIGEKSEYGTQIFPDKFGFGPIYFSILMKSEET